MKLEHEVTIGRSPASVFTWIEDPRLACRWQPDVSSYEITRECPGRVGTEFREVLRDARGSTELLGRVTAWVPSREMAFELEGRGVRVRSAYHVDPAPAGTRLRVDMELRLGGWLSFALEPLLRRRVARQLAGELETLRRLCEAEPP